MEKEEFLKYRHEIVAILEKHKIKWPDATRLFAAAMNEILAAEGYVASVSIAPLSYLVESPQTGTNLNILLADNKINSAGGEPFANRIQLVLSREIESLERATPHP